MRIFSDYDGSYEFLSSEDRESVEAIVTAANWDNYGKLYDAGVRIPVFWNPGKEELMDIVTHKANVINKAKVDKFFEDQPIQISLLKALCPRTTFVLVKGEYKSNT